MNTQTPRSSSRAAKHRFEEGLEALREELGPHVARHMRDRYGPDRRRYASRVHRSESGGELDTYVLLKTLLGKWNDLFRHDASMRKARSFVSLAMDARNSVAHFDHRGHSFSVVVPEPKQPAPEGYSVLRLERRNA